MTAVKLRRITDICRPKSFVSLRRCFGHWHLGLPCWFCRNPGLRIPPYSPDCLNYRSSTAAKSTFASDS